jgi:hypothetical protein
MDQESVTLVAPVRSKDELALELMKFISITTGVGKSAPAAGFAGKAARSPEEHAEALIQLFERCREILHKEPGAR